MFRSTAHMIDCSIANERHFLDDDMSRINRHRRWMIISSSLSTGSCRIDLRLFCQREREDMGCKQAVWLYQYGLYLIWELSFTDSLSGSIVDALQSSVDMNDSAQPCMTFLIRLSAFRFLLPATCAHMRRQLTEYVRMERWAETAWR
jgi:hypothetical protein